MSHDVLASIDYHLLVLMTAVLNGRYGISVVSICISLITKDVELPPKYSLVICILIFRIVYLICYPVIDCSLYTLDIDPLVYV